MKLRLMASAMLFLLAQAFMTITVYAADKTTRIIPWENENITIIDTWAKEYGYRELESKRTENRRVYKRGHYLLTAPVMVEVIKHDYDQKAHVDAFIKPDPFSRIVSLWILPSTMGLESGGFKMLVPRNINRTDVNVLFSQLQVELIH